MKRLMILCMVAVPLYIQSTPVSVDERVFEGMTNSRLDEYLSWRFRQHEQVRIAPSSAHQKVVKRVESFDISDTRKKELLSVFGVSWTPPEGQWVKLPAKVNGQEGEWVWVPKGQPMPKGGVAHPEIPQSGPASLTPATPSTPGATTPVTGPQTPVPTALETVPSSGIPDAPDLDIPLLPVSGGTTPKPTTPSKTESQKDIEKAMKELSAVDKAKSDALLVSVLKSLAGQYAPSKEAYAAIIIEACAPLLDARGDFKRDATALLRSMQMYINGPLAVPRAQPKQDEWLASVHTQLVRDGVASNVIQNMQKIIVEQGLFDAKAVTPEVRTAIAFFVVSCIASQRTMPSMVGAADKIHSDGLLLDTIEQALANAQVRSESKDLAALRDSRRQLNEELKKAGFKEDQKREKIAAEIKEIDTKINTPVTFSVDYLEEFFNQANFLRVDPDFFRYDLMLGKSAEDMFAKGVPTTPLLTLALSTDYLLFFQGTVLHSSLQRTLFNPDEWGEFLKGNDYSAGLTLITKYHGQQLKSKRGTFDVYRFLQQNFVGLKSEASSIKKMKELVDSAIKELPTVPQPLIALKNALQEFPIKASAVTGALQALMPSMASLDQHDQKEMQAQLGALSKKIDAISDTYNKQKKEAVEILDIVKQYKKQMGEYASKVKQAQKEKRSIESFYVGQQMINAITQKLKKLTAAQQRAFKGTYRTAKTVYDALAQLVGREELKEVVQLPSVDTIMTTPIERNFYYWIEPYGEVLELFDKAPATLTSTNAFENMNTLLTMIAALNKNVPYQGKLTQLRDALAADNVTDVVHMLDALVRRAGGSVEQSQDYKALKQKMVTFVAPIMMSVIVDEFKELDRGEYVLKALPLEGAGLSQSERRRNAIMYKSWKNIFTPLIADLEKAKNNVSQMNVAELRDALEKVRAKMVNDAQALLQEESAPVVQEINSFINATVRKITEIQAGYAAVGLQVRTPSEPVQEGAIPEAPPMEGGIPDAPPL